MGPWVALAGALLSAASIPPASAGEARDVPTACGPSEACPPSPAGASASPRRLPPSGAALLTVFWGEACPRCEAARPAVERIAAEDPRVTVEWVEVRRDPAGAARYAAAAGRLGLRGAGVPTFVAGDEALVGFAGDGGEEELRALVGRALGAPGARGTAVRLPGLGTIDARGMPLAVFTVALGLADGVNPCAMYVLVVLLGLLLHAGSRARVVLYGGAFVGPGSSTSCS